MESYYCLDCRHVGPLTTNGSCEVCGSSAVDTMERWKNAATVEVGQSPQSGPSTS